MDIKKQDLRVIRTKKAIFEAFTEMILEMDYDKINIKELTERAQINRKTFYLHYQCIDTLQEEIQERIIKQFLDRVTKYHKIHDLDKITREYFIFTQEQGLWYEHLICSKNYQHIYNKICVGIIDEHDIKNNISENLGEKINHIINIFLISTTVDIYRFWVNDNKQIPLDEIISITSKLVCNGIHSIIKD